MSERTSNGQFAPGNAGGPGRPRRAVEKEYLAVLSEAVPLSTWRTIVETAVKQATDGDDKARTWISKYCLGNKPTSLLEIASDEANGKSAEDVVSHRARQKKVSEAQDEALQQLLGRYT